MRVLVVVIVFSSCIYACLVKVSIWTLAHRSAFAHSSLNPFIGAPQMRGPNKAPTPKAHLQWVGLGLRWVRPPKNTTLSQSQRSSRATQTSPKS